MSNRNQQCTPRCITLSDEVMKWVKEYAKTNNKSVSLIIELILRSKMLNKRLDLLIDYDLYKNLVEQPVIQNPDIVQPL